MTITRRTLLEMSAGAGALATLSPSFGLAQAPLAQKTIPKTGEQVPPIGIGTNRYGVGTSEAERAPLRATHSGTPSTNTPPQQGSATTPPPGS